MNKLEKQLWKSVPKEFLSDGDRVFRTNEVQINEVFLLALQEKVKVQATLDLALTAWRRSDENWDFADTGVCLNVISMKKPKLTVPSSRHLPHQG